MVLGVCSKENKPEMGNIELIVFGHNDEKVKKWRDMYSFESHYYAFTAKSLIANLHLNDSLYEWKTVCCPLLFKNMLSDAKSE